MEWITSLLGAVIGVLVAHLFHWRTLANLTRRVNLLENSVRELQAAGEDDEPYGQQCMDLNEEWQSIAAVATKPRVEQYVDPAHTPLPVIRHMTVGGLLNLLPRRGVHLVPSLDGQGLKITATYHAMDHYKHDVGTDLAEDMKELVRNTGPVWELHTYDQPELMRYEFRVANTKDPDDG
jgi:hypothetical protein